jgi:DMSO reductase anchor subunit
LTFWQFGLTTGVLGCLIVSAAASMTSLAAVVAAAICAVGQLVVIIAQFVSWSANPVVELRGTATLIATTLRRHMLWRVLLLGAGGLIVPFLGAGPVAAWVAVAAVVAAEILGRYIFFVSAVPKHLAAPYLEAACEAA